jgi:hypothetical protein
MTDSNTNYKEQIRQQELSYADKLEQIAQKIRNEEFIVDYDETLHTQPNESITYETTLEIVIDEQIANQFL